MRISDWSSDVCSSDLDRLLQAAEDRLTNQEMPDIEFGKLRNGGDGSDIVECEAMARMRFYAVFRRSRGGIGKATQLRAAFGSVQMRVTTCKKFDHRSFKQYCGVDRSEERR